MKMPALLLVAVAAIVPAAPARPQDGVRPSAKEQIEASAKKIKELRKERIAALKKVTDQLTDPLRGARAPFGEIATAMRLLAEGKLEAAETDAERVERYENLIVVLKRDVENAEVMRQVGAGNIMTVLGSQARRLEVEIQLEHVKMKVAEREMTQPRPPDMTPPRAPEERRAPGIPRRISGESVS